MGQQEGGGIHVEGFTGLGVSVDLPVDSPVQKGEPVVLLADIGSCCEQIAEVLQPVLLMGQVCR
ncbi:hypothetical protein GCM10010406_03100 [Streptomyces thermolineatus]|uniref:Alcohol dehydrogenase N-terminal domain-containing protein n=1 Tax=Streptomyces thermolineatus TaxID=44033 RepID=A0ABN3KS97_9ACTN